MCIELVFTNQTV